MSISRRAGRVPILTPHRMIATPCTPPTNVSMIDIQHGASPQGVTFLVVPVTGLRRSRCRAFHCSTRGLEGS